MENFAGVEVFPGPYEGQSHCFSLITFYRTYCIALASMDALRTWVDCIANELGHGKCLAWICPAYGFITMLVG